MSDDTRILSQAFLAAAAVLPPALATLVQRELRTALDSSVIIERDIRLATEILRAQAALTSREQNMAVVGGRELNIAAAREAIAEAGEHVDRLVDKYRERAQTRGDELAQCDLTALCTVTPVLRTNAPALLTVAVSRLAKGGEAA